MKKENELPEEQMPQTGSAPEQDALAFPSNLVDELLSDLEAPLKDAPQGEAAVQWQPLEPETEAPTPSADESAADAADEVPAPQEPIADAAEPSAEEATAETAEDAAPTDAPETEETVPQEEASAADEDEAEDAAETEETVAALDEAMLAPQDAAQKPADPFAGLPLMERLRQQARIRRREQTRMRREGRKREASGEEILYQPVATTDVRITLIRLGISAILLIAGLLLTRVNASTVSFVLYLLAYLIAAVPVAGTAVREMAHGRYFSEYLLVFLASLGAFVLQHRPEAVFVLLLHSAGKLASDTVLARTRAELSAQSDYIPEHATLVSLEGEEKQITPQEISKGDFVLVRTGERIPIDGEVLRGEGQADQTVLTGDSEPVTIEKGSLVLAGSVYEGSLLLVRANVRFEDSAASQIKNVCDAAAGNRSKIEESVVHSFGRWMPILFIVAVLLSFLPPLFHFGSISVWMYRALTALIICCPTALIISVPLSFLCGNGRLSQKGIQVKGSAAIEKLAELRMAVFGKTGTLTQGKLRVKEIHATGDFNEESCLALAATAEQLSHHPVARAVVAAYEGIPQKISEFEEFPGRGVRVRIGKHTLLVGNRKLMVSRGVKGVPDIMGTVLYIAYEGEYAGAVVLEDVVRPEAADAIAGLKAQGVLRTVILTGDTEQPAQQVASAVGIDTLHSGLTPDEKASKMEFLLRTIPTDGTAAYVGDGINDITELSLADVGVAMGAAGSKQSADAASVLIMSNDLRRLTDAVRISRLAHAVALQDIVALLAVKAILIVLTLVGAATMWQAVAVDVLMTVLTVLNSARVRKAK